MPLTNKPYTARSTRIDLNLIELNFYPFMISLFKSNGRCYVFDDLSVKICVPSKTTDISVKAFNMIAKINEGKTNVKHISSDCKCKINSATCNSHQKLNNDTCRSERKKYCTCKNNQSRNPSTCICENGKI